jgi:hypothetical protein
MGMRKKLLVLMVYCGLHSRLLAKTTVLAALAIIVLGASPAFADTCGTTSLDKLQASSGCTIGNLSFSNFLLGNFTGGSLKATDVQVTPTTLEPGFTFTITGPTTGTSISFLVATIDGTHSIEDLSSIISPDFSTGFSTGAVENVCYGPGNNFTGLSNASGVPICTNGSLATQMVTGFGSGVTASTLAFSPLSGVALSTGFRIDGSSPVTLTEQVSVAPVSEPSSVLLLVAGLLGVIVLTLQQRRLV